MKVRVIVLHNERCTGHISEICPREIVSYYTMDHNDPAQRRILGEQCRNAFEAGQCVLTYPVAA